VISQAVILVGGRGERLNDGFRYTPIDYIPKPLTEVGGKPFVTYAINILETFGVKDIVLLVGFKKQYFKRLADDVVRLVVTQPGIDAAVLSIPNLADNFILLNGDCLPILRWDYLLQATTCIPIKMNLRDAGVAVVSRQDVIDKKVSCANIKAMRDVYPKMMIEGGLHVGTYQGLERARQYCDLVVFGQ
jgi:NDP-sugar pyrophosphorylase family protein